MSNRKGRVYSAELTSLQLCQVQEIFDEERDELFAGDVHKKRLVYFAPDQAYSLLEALNTVRFVDQLNHIVKSIDKHFYDHVLATDGVDRVSQFMRNSGGDLGLDYFLSFLLVVAHFGRLVVQLQYSPHVSALLTDVIFLNSDVFKLLLLVQGVSQLENTALNLA